MPELSRVVATFLPIALRSRVPFAVMCKDVSYVCTRIMPSANASERGAASI